MQHPQPDLNELIYRVKSLEKEMQEIRSDLHQCVTISVNELQLQPIRSTVERIEGDVKEARNQVKDLGVKQDQIQINVLKYIVVTIVSIAVIVIAGVIVYFLTRPGG